MSLLSEERKMKIMELVVNEGKVKVTKLAKDFNVSTETIRRDLEELESGKKLKKVYGGAVKLKPVVDELSMFEREILSIEEKKRIGRKAASFIQEGEIIFIDEGSTTLQMIPALKSIANVTIITNSFPLAIKLMEYDQTQKFAGQLIFLGGHVNSKHFRSSGSLTERIAKEFYVDKAFIAIDGLHHVSGMTSYDLHKCLLSKVFIDNAIETFALVDHSKIGVTANYQIERLKYIDYIISDVPLPEQLINLHTKWIHSP